MGLGDRVRVSRAERMVSRELPMTCPNADLGCRARPRGAQGLREHLEEESDGCRYQPLCCGWDNCGEGDPDCGMEEHLR